MVLVVKKMKRSEVQREKLSPMMQQYMEIKDKYEDCIIFFRLGDFYEMFFDDAILASRALLFYLRTKHRWFITLLQVMTCGCQCGS